MNEKYQELEIKGDCDEIKLTTTYLTDPYEASNHLARMAKGKAMAGKGSKMIRHALTIPFEDMTFLEATHDRDWLEYDRTGNDSALKRLLIRFPYWKVCDGRIV